MNEENKVIKVKREVIRETVFNALEEEYFSDGIKDVILDGINFKGLDSMSDRELIKRYKEFLCIDDKIKIVN